MAMASPHSGMYLSAARQRHIGADPETPHASAVVNTSRRSSARPAFFCSTARSTALRSPASNSFSLNLIAVFRIF